jgi:hypothetical protein
MSYCAVTEVKEVLQIDVSNEAFDAEIEGCIASADALIDSLLKQKGSVVPQSTPQNITDSSKYFAAWLFRRRRDPAGAEVFWEEANRFLEAFVTADDEAEPLFKVCSD